jgi:ABC-type spermidine/putrescine transport system permease subunit II
MAGGAKGPRVSLSVEPLKIALAAWTVLVLLFLFIPIILVFVHSFNRGQSFTIWSGHFSTKWWGELFWSGTAWRVLVVGAAIVAGGLVARAALVRFTNLPKRVTNWFGPGAFFAAVAWNWATTDRYRDVFKFSGVGDAVRNSFTAAFGATVIAVLIGGLAGVALARRPGTWTKVFMAVLFLILVTPEIMDAIALVTWWDTRSGTAGARSAAG